MRMEYPCIVYRLSRIDTRYGNDLPYNQYKRYQVVHITQDPDSETVGKIASLPLCAFDRHFQADNLNHYSFNLYY